MWASGEVFTKILQDNAILKADNKGLLAKYENVESDMLLLKKQ
jgi:hypothetical protein